MSETREVFRNPDGSETVNVSTEPVRFKVGDRWQNFDTKLHPGAGGEPVAGAAPGSDTVAATLAPGSPVASVATAAGPVSLAVPGATPGRAQVVDGNAVFADVLPAGTDLVVGLLPHGFESTLVVPGYGPDAVAHDEQLVVPAGVTARQSPAGVELVDGAGNVVGVYGSGKASDSTPDHPAETVVVTQLVSQAGTAVTVRNSIDPAWLADRARVFPVRIDPTFSANTAAGGFDTMVHSGYPAYAGATATGLDIGKSGSYVRRAFVKFDLGGLVGPQRYVSAASFNASWVSSPSCDPRSFTVRPLLGSPNGYTTWANQPQMGSSSSVSAAFASNGYCPAGVRGVDITSMAQDWVNGTANNGLAVVASNEGDDLSAKAFESAENYHPPTLQITYDTYPVNATPASPAGGAKIATTQPTLVINPGSDADPGDTVRYNYTVSTDPSGTSGQVLESGWTTATSWPVPAGSLVDNQTYYWTVSTYDGVAWPLPGPAAVPFKVELRTGDSGVWPTDTVGPAKVNLTNGNVVVGTSSPSFTTVGGNVGLSYTYNSRQEPTGGLTGSYYDLALFTPPSHAPGPNDKAKLVRRDPTLSFNWGTGAPFASITPDNFYGKWTGYFAVPTSGVYNLGLSCDDGARLTLGGPAPTSLDMWAGCGYGGWSPGTQLTAGTTVPITVEHWEGGGYASMNLMVKGPGLAAGGQDVPASWLLATPAAMPTGWKLSADMDGQAVYQSILVTSTTATLYDVEGTAHVYRTDPAKKAWQPPAGEHGALTAGVDSVSVLVDEDGTTYTFAANGTLTSVQSPTDDKHPAAQQLTWDPGNRLTRVGDPVSGRGLTLSYGGSPACTTPTGFSPAPPGLLCAVDYGDFAAGRTDLRYNANGQLARLEDPGGEVTDFRYDPAGRLNAIRDPLAADAVAAGVRNNDATDPTLPLSTTMSYNPAGNVEWVKAPEPQAGEARPQHNYTYANGSTDVTAAGLSSTTGKAKTAAFDATGRSTATTDQAGRVTHTAWDNQDNQVAGWDDATGLATTTVYDQLGRPTDTWGPAPVGWWPNIALGGAPAANNQGSTPHTITGYDGGVVQTLGATWWNSTSQAGPPTAHSTGVDGHPGIYGSWNNTSPAGVGSTSFSGRLTGWINITSTTPIDFQMPNTSGYARLVIDNQEVIIGLSGTPTTFTASSPYTPSSTGWKRVQLDYTEGGPSGEFDWTWRTGTNAFTRVPPSSLQPGYGLVTSTTDADGQTTQTSYDGSGLDPYYGIATSTVVDPGPSPHLGLESKTTVEAPGPGTYLRELNHTLPSGVDSTVATSYYGDRATADVPCPGGDLGVNQGGLAQTVTAANPAGGGAGGIARETRYDKATRPAATRVVADGASKWTCSTFDARGRTTRVTVPDLTNATGRVVSNDYAVSGNPLATASTDTVTGGSARTVTTVVDLLGRTRSYTDAWGNTTTTGYDQVGRPTTATSPMGTQTMGYDATGAGGPAVLDGVTYATPHYDGAGRLSWVEYANGTKSDPATYDNYGHKTTSTWRKTADNSVLASEQQSLSLGGRVVDDVTDGFDPRPAAPDYSYDGAGRLTDAWTTARDATGALSARHTAYSFGAPTGCGAGTQPQAGRNTNRITQTVGDGTAAVTTGYCYDSADRLTSTTQAGVGTPVYDGHGNTTTLYGESRGYDASDRHTQTVKGNTAVDYLRDASDRIIQRSSTVAPAAPETERYGFTGDGDTPDFTMDANGAITEKALGLPGGASITLSGGANQVWSYPNMHGDVTVITDGTGTKQGPTSTYDPYGNTTNQPLVDNSTGNYDYGWLGEKQRGTEHETSLTNTIEMGARQYDPTLGRFLETDPVRGGSANDYEYVEGDPTNNLDTNGTYCLTGKNRNGSCRSITRGIRRATRLIQSVRWDHGILRVYPTTLGRFSIDASAGLRAWAEVISRARTANRPNIRDQFFCHWDFVRYWAPRKVSWNLDSKRPDVGYWRTVRQRCNPR